MTRAALIIALFGLVNFNGQGADAQALSSCGEPPLKQPVIPSGVNATTDQIRVARQSVLDYSSNVDRYLQCMDGRINVLGSYMTEEQRTRATNALADLHDKRRTLQIALNEAIRAYRNSQQAG